MTTYKWVGPVTAFELDGVNVMLVPNQTVTMDASHAYVQRLVERNLLIGTA